MNASPRTALLETVIVTLAVEPGASDAATFVTPGPGSYTFVCTIHMGMAGTLTVE